jgi:hypothetical protein
MKADSKDKASLWRLRSLSDKSESEGGHFVWLQEDKIRIGKPEGQDQDLWKITEYDETFPGWYQ